jgi:hypothetical protein
MPDNLDYKEIRMGVRITYKVTSSTGVVSQQDATLHIPNRMAVTKRRQIEPIDGLEGGNQGVNKRYPRYTWAIALPVHVSTIRLMETLADLGEPFTIELYNITAPGTPTNNNLKIFAEKLDSCYIDNSDKAYVPNEVTYVTFSGIALRYDRQIVTGSGATAVLQYLGELAGGDFGDDVVSTLTSLKSAALSEWSSTDQPNA